MENVDWKKIPPLPQRSAQLSSCLMYRSNGTPSVCHQSSSRLSKHRLGLLSTCFVPPASGKNAEEALHEFVGQPQSWLEDRESGITCMNDCSERQFASVCLPKNQKNTWIYSPWCTTCFPLLIVLYFLCWISNNRSGNLLQLMLYMFSLCHNVVRLLPCHFVMTSTCVYHQCF